MPRWRTLLLIAAISATMSALVLAGLSHFHPFRFGRLEYAYDESWCPSPPRLILFPDGKIDMTIVDQHNRTVLIHPTRSKLTDNESSRLRALLEAVDWNRVRPHYDTEVENGEESVCRITVGNSLIETSVDAVGEAHEPEELTALFHYLNDLLLVLSPPEPANGIASDPDDEIERSDCPLRIYWEDPVSEAPDFSQPPSSPPIIRAEIESPPVEPAKPIDPNGRPFRKIVDVWRHPRPPQGTDRAIVAGLYWLAKHQAPQGNWSLQKYTELCKDKTCTGAASQESLSAATALGLLPFLAAGQTQATNGPFQRTVAGAVYWLLNHQKVDGDLSAEAASHMYSHGLATVALCEDFGMTHDKAVGVAAQKAIDFINAAQNPATGGWRNEPKDDGGMPTFAWQLTALKSAQLAGLNVKLATLDGAKKWLQSCGSGGDNVGQFSFQPSGEPTLAMSAAGIVMNQYLNADRKNPVNAAGVQLLMANLPDSGNYNVYYWFNGTQVMHNMADKDWDTWNRKVRNALVESQTRTGCASGSWDPEKPSKDALEPLGGRIMQTSLSCLTLEANYRYLPLYQLDKPRSEPAGDPERK